MNREDEYRRHAKEAQQSARQAEDDDERAAWLQLANGWLGLLRQCPQTAEKETFDTSRNPLH